MTFQDFLAQIRRELEEPSEGVWADTSILSWTNQGARDFARRTRCLRDEQYAVAIEGQYSYPMPERTLEPVAVYFDGAMLRREDFDMWANISSFDTATGTPTVWATDGTSLYLYPTPATAGEIRYFRYYHPEPVTDPEEDDMPFGGEYDDALTYYVKAKAHEQVNDWDSADRLRIMYFEHADHTLGQKAMERQSVLSSTAPREVR